MYDENLDKKQADEMRAAIIAGGQTQLLKKCAAYWQVFDGLETIGELELGRTYEAGFSRYSTMLQSYLRGYGFDADDIGDIFPLLIT